MSGGDVAPGRRRAVGHAVAGRGAAVAGRHFEQVARRVGPETAVGVGVGKLEDVEFAVIGFGRNPGDDFQREVRRAAPSVRNGRRARVKCSPVQASGRETRILAIV